ncbi:MAG: DNA polymerase IV [Desulfobacteraceae bacterium]|nr:DNA polymerase IV [Desulfobacteraceae bacterium]
MHRHIIHLHIPAFPIAVARISRSELRERPVAVAAPRSGRSPILSVSREARSEGVFKGMPIGKAKNLCPGLTVLPPDPKVMEEACQNLARAAARYTPLYEPFRPGHIYLDLTGTQRLWGKVKDTACHFRKEIWKHLCLTGTVGVASNKMVSNIASRTIFSEGSPEGVLDVDHGREAGFMAPLKVGLIPGIGRVRQKVLLEDLNIIRIRQLATLDMGSLKLIFGHQAYLIHQRASGIDHTPIYPFTKTPVVGEDITLPRDENDDLKLLRLLHRLVEKCSYRMRKKELIPKKAGLSVRYSDQVETRRQIQLPRLDFRNLDLCNPLEKLFFEVCSRRVRVGFIRVWFWEFHPPSPQLALFHAPSPDGENKTLITRAMDRIRERYGTEAITYGRHKA